MLKVAIIIERAEIGLGGAERSVSELAAELRRQGIAATVLAAKGTPSDDTQILCERGAKKRVPLKVFEKALRLHLEKNVYDIIHSTLPLTIADVYQPRGGSYREAMLQNIASYPFLPGRCFKRCTHIFNMRRTEHLNAELNLCKNSNTIIAALSHYVKQQFLQHYKLPESRLSLIPNGINPEIHPDNTSVSAIKATIQTKLSIPQGKESVFFLFAANNPRLKGFRALMYALKRSCELEMIHPILLVAGNLKQWYHRNLISQFGLKNHVVQLGKLNGIANVLSICNTAILPTYYDPCSRFILEALAMGKPVITTRFNGAAERYEHLRHGFIIDDPSDWRLVAEGMITFCDRRKIELASKAIVDDNLCEEVSIKRHVEKLIGLYNKILEKRKNTQ